MPRARMFFDAGPEGLHLSLYEDDSLLLQTTNALGQYQAGVRLKPDLIRSVADSMLKLADFSKGESITVFDPVTPPVFVEVEQAPQPAPATATADLWKEVQNELGFLLKEYVEGDEAQKGVTEANILQYIKDIASGPAPKDLARENPIRPEPGTFLTEDENPVIRPEVIAAIDLAKNPVDSGRIDGEGLYEEMTAPTKGKEEPE